MDPEPSIINSFLALSPQIIEWIGVFILLILSGLVSGSEVGFFSLTRKSLDDYSEAYPNVTEQIEVLLRDKKSLLATILILNNFINIGIVIIMAEIIKSMHFEPLTLFGSWTLSNVWVQFLFNIVWVTFMILLFGEIIPKVYAQKYPFETAMRMVSPISFFKKLLKPLSVPLMGFTAIIEKTIKPEEFSVDQLSQALEITSEDDETSQDEQKILEGIVSFGNSYAREIMTPRVDMFALNENEPFEKVKSEIKNQGYSRVPVYKENEDQIVGILYAKDLIPFLEKHQYEWHQLIRQPMYVPENKKLDDLLTTFQNQKTHIAIVVDEYGGTSGLVSLEDIIEEIVGEISDEFDEVDLQYTKIDEYNYVFEGKTNIKDFLRVIDVENEELIEQSKGDADTIAGFVLELIDEFPHKNQEIIFHNFTFTIESLNRKRIQTIKVTIQPTKEEVNE